MGRCIDEARKLEAKIEYFYSYAGENGYKQALPYWYDLNALMRKVADSPKDKGYAPGIQMMIKSLSPKMKEMEERQAT